MISDHIQYHSNNSNKEEEEEKKSEEDDHDTSSSPSNIIKIDVHIMGGFNDHKNSSYEITEWLLELLSQIAIEHAHTIQMVLKTCVVSTINDTGYGCPIGRGLALDVHTGNVFFASCNDNDDNIMGPHPVLRSVRLWSSSPPKSATNHHSLTVVHDVLRGGSVFTIEPFQFQPFQEIDWLLSLDDTMLLQCTSTSPTVEEDGFCMSVRRSLQFLRSNNCRTIFGQSVSQPLIYVRSKQYPNQWILQQQQQK